MKVFLGDNLACDADYSHALIEDALLFNGAEIVKNPEEADIIIFPAICASAISSIEYAINYIGSIIDRKKPSAKTYLTGCITRCIENIHGNLDDKTREYFGVVKEWLDEYIDFIFPELELTKLLSYIFPENPKYLGKPTFGYTYKDNYPDCTVTHIYISKGCRNNCAFCKFNFQDASLMSVDIVGLKQIIDVADEKGGTQIISLTGSNITEYGLDTFGEYKLAEIIRYIEAKKNIVELRLNGFALKDAIKQGLAETIQSSTKVELIGGGLESGSDRLLLLMKKGYTAKQVINFLSSATSGKEIRLVFSIIAGFPTETAEDIKRTIDLLNLINPANIQLVKYHDSPFIPSHKLPQFSQGTIDEHANEYIKQLTLSNIPYEE